MTEDDLRKMYRDSGLDPEPYVEKWRKAKAYDKQYEEDHAACPECGHDKYSSIYLGVTISIERPETYKDENHVQCGKCGWKGITHDLVRKAPEAAN